MAELTFEDLIRRVRAGDQEAAAELVQRYEPAIRRAVHFRLGDAHLGGMLDSMDICQSVLASFFVRAASGQYDLQEPEHLLKLLVAMARNKLKFQARKQRAQRRDVRRVVAASAEEHPLESPQPSPSHQVAARELLHEVQRRLSAEERELVEMRNQGLEWAEIAGRLGGGAEALRKKLTRALDRVAGQLGVDDEDEAGDEP
jgi:RNA polymerase sigma-70 factor (ECF subfamily)